MAYCTIEDVRRILPEKVSIGDLNIGVASPVPGRPGNQGSNRSNISPQDAEHYIEYASSYLDARLRPFYSCPLRRTKSYETESLTNIAPGNNITVTVNDSGSFIRGDLVRIQDINNMETAIVVDAPTITTFRLVSVLSSYLTSNNTRISVLEYPDPVPLITAQLAASFILDRIFVSQNSPDVSEFGKTQRNLARGQIENILSGEVLLFGQEMTGRRFVRMSLMDRWSSPAEVQKGSEKE
jgi:hypothetical protein